MLVDALQAVCPRVYPEYAPQRTEVPYVVWQHAGGEALRYLDGAPVNLRNTIVQVTVYAVHKADALGVIRDIEDALAEHATLQCEVQTEIYDEPSPELKLTGCAQDFSIFGPRDA